MKLGLRNAQGIVIMLIEIMAILIYISLPAKNNVTNALSSIGGIAFFCMLTSVILIYRINSQFNFFLCFVIFSYLFSFGQSMLVFFGRKLPTSAFSISKSGFSPAILQNSAAFCMVAICMTCIGYCFIKIGKTNIKVHREELEGETRANIVGWVLIFVSFLPTFYILYTDIINTFSAGYASTLLGYTGFAKICSLISGFFTSGMLMVLCFERNTKKRVFLYGIIAIYAALQLIGGSRISIFRLGVMILIIFNIYFKNINKKRTILIIIACLIGTFIFSLISASRIYLNNINNLGQFISETAENILKNNFLEAVIREMGNTQIINTLVFKECPSTSGYQFGLSYIKMLWAIIPNFIGSAYTGYIGVDITFSKLYMKTNAGLGASYIAEGYWNFGYFSIVAFVLFGAFLGWIEQKFRYICNNKRQKATILFLHIYIMYFMIFIVRSESLEFGRNFVYYCLIPIFLCKIRLPKQVGQKSLNINRRHPK